MLRSALLVLSGNSAAAVLGLLRTLSVATLIPVADFGIAATFAVVVAVAQMASAFGLQQQIIQARDGEDPALQAGLQGFQFLRGVLASAVLFLLAGPIAMLLRVPEVTWAYQVLALMPLLGSLQHFDIHRLTRARRFGPLMLTSTLPAALSVAAVWPLAQLFGDYRVMLYALLIQAASSVVLSHLVAERPYRLAFDRAIATRSLRFGWPLLVNNLLLFAVFHGDKVIVGRELGLEALAVFAMGLTLTLTPALVMTRTSQNLFMPVLSQAQTDPERFRRLAAACLQGTVLMAVALAILVLAVGELLVVGVYGDKFAALLPLLLWLVLAQSLRMAKAGPATVALAVGESRNAMLTNLPRLALVPIAWAAAIMSGELWSVVLVAIAAEMLGLVLAFWLLWRRVGVAALGAMPTLGAALATFCALAIWAMLRPDTGGTVLPPFWVWMIVLGLFSGAVWLARDLRLYLRQHLRI